MCSRDDYRITLLCKLFGNNLYFNKYINNIYRILFSYMLLGAPDRWCVCRGDQTIKVNVVVKDGGTNT